MTAGDLRNPEQIVDNLPDELALRLGVLADRSEEEMRVNLGLQLFGTAALLKTYGLVDYRDYEKSVLELAKNPGNDSAARMVHVTDLGKNVMSLCQSRLPEGDERDKLEKEVLDLTEYRRIIVRNALTDTPHPATMLIKYIDRKKPSAE